MTVEFLALYDTARGGVVQGELGIMDYSVQLQEKFRGVRGWRWGVGVPDWGWGDRDWAWSEF